MTTTQNHPVGSTIIRCCAYCGSTKSLATVMLVGNARRLLCFDHRQDLREGVVEPVLDPNDKVTIALLDALDADVVTPESRKTLFDAMEAAVFGGKVVTR